MNLQQLPEGFSPKAMMKALRPERFSDTSYSVEHPLSRPMLEYHLDTLTSRNEDTEFERFALALVRRAICPNLRGQTGPTGGGDSKVDTETYPVADQLTYSWLVGDGTNAASERWGFAFSAKKDWQPKLKSDIAKIAATGRGYTKAFFVSNQFIPDRKASALEDELRTEHGMDVRILSRTWILDEVFTRKLEDLATELLQMKLPEVRSVRLGPLDSARVEKLEALDKKIDEAISRNVFDIDLVHESLESARLARELERPRVEVEGRYARAERLATKVGASYPILLATYQLAWTAYFWHEDFARFDELYTRVEERSKGTDNPSHLEHLNNLWHLAFALNRVDTDAARSAKLPARTIVLADALNWISNSPERPNAALQAKSMLLLQQITATLPKTPSSVFSDLRKVIAECDGLVGFPLTPVAYLVQQFGAFVDNNPEYEALFNEVVDLTSRRAGEVQAAMMRLRRGAQKLEKGAFYEAITLIGWAVSDLATDETREELTSALNLLAHAYEQVGFLWAARGALLNSLSLILHKFESTADTSRLRRGPIPRMKWLELQLGRLAPCFEWASFDRQVSDTVRKEEAPGNELGEMQVFDLGIAILLLRSTQEQFRALSRVPDVLGRLGFPCARGALLCALGHEDDFYRVLGKEGDKPEDVFQKLDAQPLARSISPVLVIEENDIVILKSKIWGCVIEVITPVTSPYLELAESILAAMEATLATAGQHRVLAMSPTVSLNILPSDCEWFEFDPSGFADGSAFAIRCGSFDAGRLSREDQATLRGKICDSVAQFLVHVFVSGDFESTVLKLFRDERGFERGTNFTTSFVTYANVFGTSPQRRISDWLQPDDKTYESRRVERWNQGLEGRTAARATPVPPDENAPPDGDGTGEWRGFGEIDQRQFETLSLIRKPLWDKAGWRGVAFLWDPADRLPPLLALYFKSEASAASIFSAWQKELGARDEDDRLRILIIQGVMRSSPSAYRVSISSEPSSGSKSAKYFSVISRFLTMEPSHDQNLTGFLARFDRFKQYGLTYAVVPTDGKQIAPNCSATILKRVLTVRQAFEIGIGDLDSVVIQADDDPVIPAGADTPITALLHQLRRDAGG